MSEIDIVIPSRELTGLLRACVGAAWTAMEAAPLAKSGQIIVVDNGSPKPYSHNDFDHPVRLVRFDAHQTFAKCCNEGAKKSSARAVLFLNNDVILARGAIRSLLTVMHRESADIVGLLLEFPDGLVQHAGIHFQGEFPANAGRYEPSDEHLGHSSPVVGVTGAAMAITQDALKRLGGWDEGFMFGHEDVDLCLRARGEGMRIWLASDTRSLHLESFTPGRSQYEDPSRQVYVAKWHSRVTRGGPRL
jgi:GT2 family glycosyltransferase